MKIKSYIGGEYASPSNTATLENINPATNKLIGEIEIADSGLIDTAVESAETGFIQWKKMSGKQRAAILRKTSDLLRGKIPQIAEIEVEDCGKPIREALSVDIQSGADCLDYYASIAETLHGDHVEHPNAFSMVKREPLGVCAGIGAWNYPIQIACWKSAPALACGNSFIFKPSEMTPRSALILAETYLEAGLPPGVFNVIQGDHTSGSLLANHAKIRKISLTGSVSTGKKVMATAANNLKKVTMELGGKSALIIMPDANIESAVHAAMAANFYTQGEICSNGTRVFVHSSIQEEFSAKLVEYSEKLVVGDPKDPATQIGALISNSHTDKVRSYIEMAKKQGATVLTGEHTPAPKGNYVNPTVLTNCNDEMTHVQQEIFGPVMSLLEFKDTEEVIRRANQTEFGLAAGLFCNNLAQAHQIADRLEAGFVWINNYNITPIEVPFGGVKMSGIGRENGWAAVNEYTEAKTIYVELAPVESAFID